mgnify:CR=1 FL=1
MQHQAIVPPWSPQSARVLVRDRSPALAERELPLRRVRLEELGDVGDLEPERAEVARVDELEHRVALGAGEDHRVGPRVRDRLDVPLGHPLDSAGLPGPVEVVTTADLVRTDDRPDTAGVHQSDRRVGHPHRVHTQLPEDHAVVRKTTGEKQDLALG